MNGLHIRRVGFAAIFAANFASQEFIVFIGHYAPALIARTRRNSPSLAACFVAVQLLDVGFFSLAAFGIERWKPNPQIHGIMPVDLYYMPYTHSLLAAVAWSVAAGAVYLAMRRRHGKATAAMVAALVFSHWLIDLIVHRRDLGVIDDEGHKLGFGLWNVPAIAMALEIALLVVGLAIYMRMTRPVTRAGLWSPWLVVMGLCVLQAVNWFAPIPESKMGFSVFGLFAYALCAALAWLLDRTRARIE